MRLKLLTKQDLVVQENGSGSASSAAKSSTASFVNNEYENYYSSFSWDSRNFSVALGKDFVLDTLLMTTFLVRTLYWSISITFTY